MTTPIKTIEVNSLRLTVGWRLNIGGSAEHPVTDLYLTKSSYEMVRHYTGLEYFDSAHITLFNGNQRTVGMLVATIRAELE